MRKKRIYNKLFCILCVNTACALVFIFNLLNHREHREVKKNTEKKKLDFHRVRLSSKTSSFFT